MKYIEHMESITKEELLSNLLSYGFFSNKIPPFLSSKGFYNWSLTVNPSVFSNKPKDYIRYDSMRNINIPRPISIPHPVTYRNLCKNISDNWDIIKKHFNENTQTDKHKISQIHIRKMKKNNGLFQMNYKNIIIDGDLELDLAIGANFIVQADISNCYPSIYSHSIPWALVGKSVAKENINTRKKYYNKLDENIRNIKYGETHGILIGPHSSNIISEIVLVKIDNELSNKGYKFIRNIDDYTCYVEDHHHADNFLIDLSLELKKFELTLNHKKTKIMKLPLASVEHWVRKLNSFEFSNKKNINYKEIATIKEVKSYIDLAIELMDQNNENTAILFYALKVLSKKYLGKVAQNYLLKKVHHLILLYPYLVQVFEDYIIIPFNLTKDHIIELSNDLYKMGVKKKYWEAVSYSLYFSIKYNFKFDFQDNIIDDALKSDDCIFLLLGYLYNKKNKLDISNYKDIALEKKKNDFDRYWLFIFEILNIDQLSDCFKDMKNKKVTFLDINISPTYITHIRTPSVNRYNSP